MAPKSSQRTSLGSSQPQPFQAAVTKLCKAIDDVKGKKGEIKAQSIVTRLKEYISDFRKAKKILGSEIITLVVGCLDNDGSDICSRLDPAIFCTVLELVLQTEECIEGERCLFLLAKSLFYDAQDHKNEKTIATRKVKIGEGCCLQLLGYFIDEKTAPTMRRWAGILCIQLFSDCKKNCEWMEYGPEDYRRGIGRAVFQEHDEILRMIYGQLVRTLLKGGLELEDLFPLDFKQESFADFPPSTQDNYGWGGSFQKYLDRLFDESLIKNSENDSLWFATTVTMQPECELGVPGHHKYVFLHQVEGSHPEMSIFAPAQPGTFDRILDIPIPSITTMSIVTDEYSQVASGVDLELRGGKGLEFFLDSENIHVDSIHLTLQPNQVRGFKEELMGKCPRLKVAQTDKATALQPSGSDSQLRTSQSDDILVGPAPNMPKAKNLSSKTPESGRSRKTSIPETQVEQDDRERSTDMEDELQNPVDASRLNVQDKRDEEATPRNTKEHPKVTSGSEASGSKPTAPPKGLRGGIKPKAKPPIVQRDLRNKPSQASTQEPVGAAGGQNQAKQAQSTGNVQPLPTTQVRKSTSDSTTKMPPPKGKTRSTRSSQVTDDVAESQISDRPRPLMKGTQKSSVNAPKPSTATSKTSAKPEVKPGKTSAGLHRTGKPSQTSKKSEQDFSDDFITDVDEMDASTPKVAAAASQKRKATTAASKTNTQTNKVSDTASSTTRKRYSLYPPPKTTPSALDTYDIPVDENEEATSQKTKGKKSTKGRKSAPTTTTSAKTASKAAPKAERKKRQSAPAALDRPVGTRNSQRAAAAKANKQLQGADKSDVEDDEVQDEPETAKSQATRKSKTTKPARSKVHSQDDDQRNADDAEVEDQSAPARSQNMLKSQTNPARMSTKSKGLSAKADKVVLDQDDDMPPLSQADEMTPSLVQNNLHDHVDVENLYDATPKQPSQKPLSQKPQGLAAKVSKAPMKDKRDLSPEKDPAAGETERAEVQKASKKGTRNSGLDMADKLRDIPGDVSDDIPEAKDQNSGVRKELKQTIEPQKRKPTKTDSEDAPTNVEANRPADNKSKPVTSKYHKPVVWNVSSSPMVGEEREQGSISPPVPKQTIIPSREQEKLKPADDEIFKKPAVPMLQKKTPMRPEAEAPSTTESMLSEVPDDGEPGDETGTSAVTNRVIASAEQDTPMDFGCDGPETGNGGRKRKTELHAITPPKRQRIDQSQDRPMENSPAASLPSSPPIRAKPSPKKPEKSRKSTEHVASPRRSPRLMDRARQAAEALQQATSAAPPARKDPDRKPHLVSFGVNGALNQGISSTGKILKDPASPKNMSDEPVRQGRKNRPSTVDMVEEAPEPVRHDNGEKKRKRETLGVIDAESLTNKRRSVSPMDAPAVDEHDDEDGGLPDSPTIEKVKTKSNRNRRNTKPPTRPSSQTSRVDKNGSPMASSQEDHIEKLRERLADKSQVSSPAPVESPVTIQPRRLSEVFGPRVMLEKKLKARNSSPEETAARYVAHEKTANGVYQEVATKKVITLEKVHDPFAENGRKISGFTERLLSEASTGTYGEAPKQREVVVGEKRMRQDAEPSLALHTRVSKLTQRQEPARRTYNDRERTRVAVETDVSDLSNPSEMTMDSSCESQSSEPNQMPSNEQQTASAVWNVAIRPHYANLREAIYRIADDVLLRLQDEEDQMGLLAQQYKEEGGKIISKLEERHANEKVVIVHALNQKRTEMASMYSEAKELVMNTATDLKENSTSQFDREWRKRQDAIREEIAEGRKVSGL